MIVLKIMNMNWLLKFCNNEKKCILCNKNNVEFPAYFNGDGFCSKCGNKCSECGEAYILHGAEGLNSSNICPDCKDKNNINNMYVNQNLFIDFYNKYPNLEPTKVLERAAKGETLSEQEYVNIFNNFNWSINYGGPIWANITKSYFNLYKLNQSDTLNLKECELAIDHAFDLVHNTDSVLTKAPSLKSWIKAALDIKREISPEHYFNKTSYDVRELLKEYYSQDYSNFDSWDKHRSNVIKTERLRIVNQIIDLLSSDKSSDEKIVNLFPLIKSEDILQTPYFYLIDFFKKCISEVTANKRLFYGYFSFLNLYFIKLYLSIFNKNDIKNIVTIITNFDPSFIINATTINNSSIIIKNLYEALKQNNYITNDFFNEEITETNDSLDPSIGNSHAINFIKHKDLQQKDRLRDWWQTFEQLALTKRASIELNEELFYDFYALSYIDCSKLKNESRTCVSIKQWTYKKVLNSLVTVLGTAIVMEAKHVKDYFASTIE